MKRFNTILWKFVDPHFAAQGNAKTASEEQESLKADLISGIRSEEIAFWFCVGMVTLLFLGAYILVCLNLNRPKFVQIIFGITGISFTALIRQMISLWKERARMVLVKQLADSLPSKDIKSVIMLLLKANQK